MASGKQKRPRRRRYTAFRRLNGGHPYRKAVPDGHVDYKARRVPETEVVWFHFPLAKELGLLPPGHPHRLNQDLKQAICGTFGLVIINEYDLENDLPIPEEDVLAGSFMATRYLQLQHPDRRGTTSGDGRSIWNGSITHRGRTWDLSSCGTGVTRLCPATAEQKRFFRTASDEVSYGCGTAAVEEGFETLLMSEAFHLNGIPTERVLAILQRPDGFAIVVRVAPNLLRPSHFFAPLKQGNLSALQGAVDYFIRRQTDNGIFPRLQRRADRYRHLAEEMARTFARAAATFESEYIFCWLDWDGDNILADGGIIDYGSVRQFGLYHREYRFDDGPRMSTSLPEQRRKARYIVQCFAQIRDFLVQGAKPPLATLDDDVVLDLFDNEFQETRLSLLLRNIGCPPSTQETLLAHERPLLEQFRRAHAHFERARSAAGLEEVSDGLNWNAVFSTRDLLRELPQRYLHDLRPVPALEFLEIGLSTYADDEDCYLTPYRRHMAGLFQRYYIEMIRRAAHHEGMSVTRLLAQVAGRAGVINRYARITGDSISDATERLLKARRYLTLHQLQRIVEHFVSDRVLIPDLQDVSDSPIPYDPRARRLLQDLDRSEARYRHGL